MSYVFSAQEQQLLRDAINQSTGLTPDQGSTPQTFTPKETGDVAPFYSAINRILVQKMNDSSWSSLDSQTQSDILSAKLWVQVALGANQGIGSQSEFIRTYTNYQGTLRIGREFTAGEMQKASNGVGANFATELLKNWTVPSISELARADASSIGENLYTGTGDETAVTHNTGWAGTFGFNLLGGEAPFETNRLYSTGDVNKYDFIKLISWINEIHDACFIVLQPHKRKIDRWAFTCHNLGNGST